MNHIQTYKIFEKKNTFVNFNTFKLDKWYDKLNKVLFSGRLSRVPLKWDYNESNLGSVNYDKKSKEIYYLSISRKYKLTEAELLSVLAHEMIHVFQIKHGEEDTKPHGEKFQKWMEKINNKNKYGIDVKIKQPMGHLKMINPDLEKPLELLLLKKSNDKKFNKIVVFDADVRSVKDLLKIIKDNKKGSGKVQIQVRQTNNGVISQYDKSHEENKVTTYDLDEVTLNTIMKDSRKVKELTL